MEWTPPWLPSVLQPKLRHQLKRWFKIGVSCSLFILTWNLFLCCKLFQLSWLCSPLCLWLGILWIEVLFRRRQSHSIAKIIDFASLSLAVLLMPGDFQETLLFFSVLYQLPLWFHHARPLLSSQPFEMRKRPVIQLLKLPRSSLGPERKPAALIPLSPRERLATWLFVAAIWYIHCLICCCWGSLKEGHKVFHTGFVSCTAGWCSVGKI